MKNVELYFSRQEVSGKRPRKRRINFGSSIIRREFIFPRSKFYLTRFKWKTSNKFFLDQK